MGLPLLDHFDMFTPLQLLANRWLPTRRQRSSATRYLPLVPGCNARQPPKARHRSQPLRVVHMVDPGQHGLQGGCMVISGRMSEVCAELDRLAALEAAAQQRH